MPRARSVKDVAGAISPQAVAEFAADSVRIGHGTLQAALEDEGSVGACDETGEVQRAVGQILAYPPIGVRQEPSSCSSIARSAVAATIAGASSMVASRSRSLWSSCRTVMPMMPCPAAGTINSGSSAKFARSVRPRRFSPATASSEATQAPSFSLPSRVCTLPRSVVMRMSGRWCSSCACRRTEEVPTTAPTGRAGKRICRIDPGWRIRKDQGVARILPLERASEHDARWQRRLQILEAVNCEIDAPLVEGFMDLLGEQALAADLGEAAILHSIARGADDVLIHPFRMHCPKPVNA